MVACRPIGELSSDAGGIHSCRPQSLRSYLIPPQFHPSTDLSRNIVLYARRLETLRAKLFLTEAEKMEEVRLKKLKLSLKDEIERLRRPGATVSEH